MLANKFEISSMITYASGTFFANACCLIPWTTSIRRSRRGLFVKSWYSSGFETYRIAFGRLCQTVTPVQANQRFDFQVTVMRQQRKLSLTRRTILPLMMVLGWVIPGAFVDTPAFGQAVQFQINPFNVSPQRSPTSTAGLFPRNREYSRIVGRAEDAIEKKQFREAVTLLQLILNDVEDGSTAFISNSTDDNVAGAVNISVRSRAYSLLASLPKEGRQAYELMAGRTARDALAMGMETGDVASIEDVARRYLLTEAGRDAGLMLARLHMDRNEFFEAALRYSRLTKYYAVDPEIELRAAFCWARANLPSDAITSLRRLRDRTKSVRVGPREVKLFSPDEDPVEWLESALQTGVAGLPAIAEEWLRPFGNESQNASGAPVSTHGDALWSASVFELVDLLTSETKGLKGLSTAYSSILKRNVGEQIPARRPLVIGDMAVFRAFGKLQAVDVTTGELQWESATLEPAIAEVIRDYNVDRNQFVRRSTTAFLGIDAITNDLTTGTISSDGRHVFSIEEAGVISGSNQRPVGFNILRAYDVKSGKTVWDVGGKLVDNGPALAGRCFLGPPLILGGRIYVLAEFREQIMLLALHEEQDDENRWSVRSDWSVIIANTAASIDRWAARRVSGISPTFSDGKLICPTSAGAYVAVDLIDRMPIWGYQYVPNAVPNVNGRTTRGFVRRTSGWFDSTARVTGEQVLLAPNDVDEVHCVDLSTGQRLWKKKQNDRRYIATADSDRVVIVATNRVEALESQTGTVLWDAWLGGETIAGLGVAEGNRYHVPLVSGKIATLDVTNGRVLSVAGNIVPGNLVSTNRLLLSQSSAELVAYPSRESSAQNLAKADLSDPDVLVEKAVFELQHGDVDESLAQLRKAISMASADDENATATLAARALLRNTLLAGVRVKDAHVTSERLEELGALLKGDDSDEARQVIWQFAVLKTDRLVDEKKYGAAVEQILQTATNSMSSMRQIDGKRSVRFDRWIYANTQRVFRQAAGDDLTAINRIATTELANLVKNVGQSDTNATGGDVDVSAPLTNKVTAGPTLSMNDSASLGEQRLATAVAALSGLDSARQLQREWMKSLSPQIHPLRLESILRHQRNDAKTRAAATLGLLRLYSTQNRYDLVVPLLKEVETQYAAATIETEDGAKTGQQLIDAILNNSTASAELKAIRSGWSDRELAVRRSERRDRVRGVARSTFIPFASDSGVFSGWSFRWDSARRNLIAVDSLGRVRWTTQIQLTNMASTPFNVLSARIWSAGHLLLVSHDSGLFAVDGFGIHPTEMWSKPAQQFAQNASRIVSLTSNGLLYATPTELVFVDPLTGKILWGRVERNASASRCVSNEDYAVIPSTDGHTARVFDLLDGAVQTVVFKNSLPPDDRFQAMLRRSGAVTENATGRFIGSVGTNILAVNSATDGVVVSSTNPIRDEVAWTIKLNRQGVVADVVDQFLSVVDKTADGKHELRIHSGSDGGVILKSAIDIPDAAVDCSLLVSPAHFLVIVNHGDMQWSRRWSPLHFRMAYAVNGTVFAFDRQTGKPLWQTPVSEKYLVRDHASALPILGFFYRVALPAADGGASIFRRYQFGLSVLDARNGDELFDRDDLSRSLNSAQIGAESTAGTLSVQVLSATIMLGPDRIINRVVVPEVDLHEGNGAKSPEAKSPGAKSPDEIPSPVIPPEK